MNKYIVFFNSFSDDYSPPLTHLKSMERKKALTGDETRRHLMRENRQRERIDMRHRCEQLKHKGHVYVLVCQ